MEIEMKTIENHLKNLKVSRVDKIGIDSIKVYEFYDFQLEDFVKNIAKTCIELCNQNALSGQGKNSCQHDIDAIKKHFDL